VKDIIDEIETAVGCQQCGGQLAQSPSADFCSSTCQELWHAARSTPLGTYVEAGHDFIDDQVRFNAPPSVTRLVEPGPTGCLESGPGYLFVGGSAHGRFIRIGGGARCIRVPRPIDFAGSFTSGLPRQDADFATDEYVQETIGFHDPDGLEIRAKVFMLSGTRELSGRYSRWAIQALLFRSGLGPEPRQP
jgi:hypothetical protein